MIQKVIDVPYRFKCRPYQYEAWKAIDSGAKRLVCCWHRGCGKDLLFLNALIVQAIRKPGVYLHCFPKYNQGKKAIWNSVHETHEGEMMAYLDHFPQEIVKHKNASEMMIQLHNGSVYCIMGIDGKNATQARGMNPCFVILSEYAYMDPESWQTLEPRVAQNNGTVIFLSTPNGQNHFYKLYNHAKENPNEYFSSLLSIDDTHALSTEYIDNRRAEGVPEDFIQQEYYCSFTRGAEGSYYGKQIQQARDDDRLTNLSIVSDLPVSTAWDIGIGDSTAIWLFQALPNGKYNFLHYYENHGTGLEHYIKYLENWRIENHCIFGKHFVPFDMMKRELGTGNELVQVAANLGMKMTIVPKKGIEEGIQACRSFLALCSFDIKRCKRGIECLDFYRKKWNDMLKVYYDEPLHDQYSHGADAFRYCVTGIKTFGADNSGRLTSDTILEMRKRNLGY